MIDSGENFVKNAVFPFLEGLRLFLVSASLFVQVFGSVFNSLNKKSSTHLGFGFGQNCE